MNKNNNGKLIKSMDIENTCYKEKMTVIVLDTN